MIGTAARLRLPEAVRLIDVNGLPGLAIYQDGNLITVVALTVDDRRITRHRHEPVLKQTYERPVIG